MQITALRKWSVTIDDRRAVTARNQAIVLHALVLAGGRARRDALASLIPNPRLSHERRLHAVRNALVELRRLAHERELPLVFSEGGDDVTLEVGEDVSVDLWEFFDHVRFERFDLAADLIRNGAEPALIGNESDRGHPAWRKTFERFREKRATVVAAIDATSGRRRSMLDVRERLLARPLVPGVGRQVAIRDVRKRLDRLVFPWSWLRPADEPGRRPLPQLIAETLGSREERRDLRPPRQVVLVGGSGAGKTLTAISTYLLLTDALEGELVGPPERAVLYVDPHAEGAQEGFGSDAWYEQRLREMGGAGYARPIVIMPHADAYLAAHQRDLDAVLESRLLRDSDVLLCCSERLYSRRLCYADVGTQVVKLEPWDGRLQQRFATEVYGPETGSDFRAWVARGEEREQLCTVPLNLVQVLAHLDEDADALADISTPLQLFDEVARLRMRVARVGDEEDELFADLASLAHRFYVEAAPADAPIRFRTEDLRQHLAARGGARRRRRMDALIEQTLLSAPGPGKDELRFETPSWGWFFVARHLVHTLAYQPAETVRAFSKFLSADVMNVCKELLEEQLVHHADAIYKALRSTLCEPPACELGPARLAIAREQVGYLLGAFADQRIRTQLAPLVEPGGEAREPSHFVRRGIVFGLADGGASQFADDYVARLRAEREGGGATPERDANLGFLLSFRGDQRFNPECPDALRPGADPLQTVADLVRGLDEDRHPGSWRIKLFSLLDLGQHPAIDEARFAAAIEPHLWRLERVADRLERDPERRDWTELPELRALLGEWDDVAA